MFWKKKDKVDTIGIRNNEKIEREERKKEGKKERKKERKRNEKRIQQSTKQKRKVIKIRRVGEKKARKEKKNEIKEANYCFGLKNKEID